MIGTYLKSLPDDGSPEPADETPPRGLRPFADCAQHFRGPDRLIRKKAVVQDPLVPGEDAWASRESKLY